MKKNMGTIDRIIRFVIAIVIISLYAAGTITGTLATILLIIAIVFALTGVFGFCPLYSLLRIGSSKKPVA